MSNKSRAILLVLLLVPAAAGCGPEDKPAATPANPLDADWLGGESSINAERLRRVLQLADSDPAAKSLVADAQAQLGKGDFAALAQRFSACPTTISVEGGFTTAAVSDVWMPRTVEDLAAGKLGAETERKLADLEKAATFRSRRVDHPDFVLLERTMLPEICIAPRLSVADAYEAIIHELHHALKRDPRAARDTAATATDERSFQLALSQVPGGEVEAYLASTRARLRLGHRGKRTAPLLSVVDSSTGEPRAAPARIAEIVLAPKPTGLGYSQGLFRGVFAEARRTLREQLTSKRAALDTAVQERRTKIASLEKNVEVQSHNAGVHRHNLGLDTAKADKAIADKARAGLADAEREIASLRKLIEVARASEKRLDGELATVTAELAKIP